MKKHASLVVYVTTACFGFVAILVTHGLTSTFDKILILSLRTSTNVNVPVGPVWVQEAMSDISALGGYPIILFIGLLVLILLLATHKWREAIYLAAAVATGSLLSTALKFWFDRPRPQLVDHLDVVHTASFPSAHAMMSMIFYLTIAMIVCGQSQSAASGRCTVGAAVFVALAVGISRVYLGVHWPSDVLAGWCVGAAWAGLCWIMANRFFGFDNHLQT